MHTFLEHIEERFGIYEGVYVPLEQPMIEATKDKGNVIKIQFGDTTGLTAKINDRAAAKSFAARHQRDTKNDKTKAGYWACRLPKYAKQLGLTGGGSYFW